MDFERKAELGDLLADQDPDIKSAVVDTALPAVIENEPELGPVPPVRGQRDKPDETALAAYVDDLREFEHDHAGDTKLVQATDKLKSSLLDDLAHGDRERMFGGITAADEQLGFVADFHADLAIEGAAVDVPKPNDYDLAPAASHPDFVDEDEYRGGGGGGGGGNGDAPPDDAPPVPPDKPDKPRKDRR